MIDAKQPRYQQLKALIVGRINNGELAPGDRVPSEHELVEATGVSRMTANRALRELNDEGLVERIAGKGTFVAAFKADSHVLEVRNIADEVRHRGHVHSACVLAQAKQGATIEVADLLHLDRGDKVFHVLVVHRENDVPIQIESRYVRCDFAPDFSIRTSVRKHPAPTLAVLRRSRQAEHVVRAVAPTADIRRQLNMNDDEPCLVVSRRTWTNREPVTFARLYHPGSKFELTGNFVPPGSANGVAAEPETIALRDYKL